MKIVKYFLVTLLGVWTAILLVMAYQSRDKNKYYRKIKEMITNEKFKEKYGFDTDKWNTKN